MADSTTLQKSLNSAVLRRSLRGAFPSAVRGQGVYVWDSEGERYLDFSGSAAVNLIGHGVTDVPRRHGRTSREPRIRS